jgi:2-aminoadipate transaminase
MSSGAGFVFPQPEADMPPLPLSDTARRTTDSPISFFIQKAIETEGLISLAAGLVDESHVPTKEVAAVVAEMMADPAAAKAALQYGSTQGLPALREQVLNRVCQADGVKPSDINLSVADVVLTTGSQQLLYLLGETLFNSGDIVICEAPSYFVYHGVLQSRGVKVLTVPMDDGGMDVDALAELLAKLERTGELDRVRLIYTVDYFQNPTGLIFATERRSRLVELARKFSKKQRILILEDAAYRELRYSGPDRPSVKKFDTTNEYVIYTTTFSKPCAPGLKTGYSLLPSDLVGPVCHLKGNHDFGSTNLSQHILNRLMASGAYHRHVETLRGVYRTKRDAMLRAMETEFADWPDVTWTTADGGMYVWATFPDHINTGSNGQVVKRALAEGVLYVPGEFGHVADETGKVRSTEMRLSFGVCEPEQITEGIRRLRRACRGLEGKPAAKKAAAVV